MTQDMATAVLTDKVTQVRAQTHVCNCRLVVTPFLDGETLEENKALAIDEVCTQFGEALGEVGKGEVALYTISRRTIACMASPNPP